MVNTFKDEKLIYLPVTNSLRDIKTKYPFSDEKAKQCSWWSDNPLLHYNAMLISAYRGIGNIKDRSQIRDEVLFFGDSGGFQVLQNKLNPTMHKNISKKLTWEKVIQWQMKVCDVGMTLDIPTPRTWDQIRDRKIFEDRLKESKKNAISMLEYKNKHIEEAYNPDFKLFNCIQGGFYEDMERWYDVTTNHQDYEYDGFSLPNSEMGFILPLRLGFAIEHSKDKPFHLLGTSSPKAVALIAYANKYTDTQVYFDSSSVATGKKIRKYIFPHDFTGSGMKFKEDREYKNFRKFPCSCPVCSQLENPEDLWSSKSKSGTLLTLHNLYWMTNYVKFISNFVYCEEEFKIFVTRLTSNNPLWILRYMEFLDYVNENGLETAWNKYFVRNEPIDSLFDESDKEGHDILMLNASYNSKIGKLQKDSTSKATEACNDMMKKDTLNPYTQETVKVKELADEELANISTSYAKTSQKRSVKKLEDLLNEEKRF